MRLALVLVAVTGCVGVQAWDLPATVSPTGTDAFKGAVTEAASAWNAVLAGCPMGVPFVVADGGHPVTLVPDASWTEGDGEGAWEDGDQIQVRDLGRDPEPAIVHELGHTLGLDHVDPSVDVYSVMKPIIGTLRAPSQGDAQRARALLGCP